MNKVCNNETFMCFSKRKNNKKINPVDNDGWMDISVGINEFRMDRDDVIEDDYLWNDGTVKMWDLKTNKIVPSIKVHEVKIEIDQVELFNTQREVEIEEMKNKLFMDSLPKFSANMLEKMKKASEEATRQVSCASKQFYTWEKGVTASATSHSAWGHRRKGGGKRRLQKLEEMNSEKTALAKAKAKRIRQTANKVKAEIESSKRAVTMVRLNAQKALLDLNTVSMKGADVEVADVVNTSDIILAEKIAEWQKFKNDEIAFFNAKVNSVDFDSNKYLPSVKVVTPKVVETKWMTIDKKKVKRDKDAKMLVISLYKNPVDIIISTVVAVEKVSWKKSKPASLMCRSVVNGEKCPHPVGKCNFAHTTEDLNPKNCVNKCCRFVKKIADKFVNKGNKICTFLHEGEVKSNLCRRIGMKFVEAVVKVVIDEKQPLWVTPMSDRVLKRYSSDLAWGPVK
jgi:hypothetical protein